MKHFDPKKHNEADFRYAHLKRDGHFVKVVKDEYGRVQYFTRNYNVVDLSFLPANAALVNSLPKAQYLDCELWKPGEKASYVSSGIANRDSEMLLEVHGVSPVNGNVSRGATLCEAHAWCRRMGLQFVPYFDRKNSPLSLGIWSGVRMWDDVQVLEQLQCEGIVLKHTMHDAEPLKYKPTRTADLQVVDIEVGTGKFEGLIGSLTCALANGTVVANVSGMTDSVRQELTEQWQAGTLRHKIVEVKYQYVGSQGKLRHPAFLRLRLDKDVADGEVL